jgi:HK97 family phage major capsid protein
MHFGDFSQAVLLGSRRDLTVSFSDSALNGFESDLITVRTTCRFDINCANVGSTSAAGSLVTLKAGGA